MTIKMWISDKQRRRQGGSKTLNNSVVKIPVSHMYMYILAGHDLNRQRQKLS